SELRAAALELRRRLEEAAPNPSRLAGRSVALLDEHIGLIVWAMTRVEGLLALVEPGDPALEGLAQAARQRVEEAAAVERDLRQRALRTYRQELDDARAAMD